MAEESDVVRLAARRVGTVLRGKYRIDRVLGVGGMAVVYAATHRNKKRFAIKMLHPELSMRDEIRARFLREGYVANSVEHPGAVTVLDDDVAEDGAAFLVMELLDGAGVDKVWGKHDNRLPVRVVLAMSYQLLDVLAAAHGKTIVHRDIKPANVFLTRDGTLKVLDFGIARLRDATSDQATQTGMMMGTPAFMAPEQALGQSNQVDGLTDVWAVGATMYSLLSGGIVHDGDNAQMLMVRAATRPARSLASVATSVPPPVVELVDRALAFDKAHRWPSAAAMRDAVSDAYVAAFSSAISPEVLAGLSDDAGRVNTLSADAVASAPAEEEAAALSIPLTRVSGRPPPASHRTATAVGMNPSPVRPGAMIGGTTAQPTSRDGRREDTLEIPRSSAARIVVPAVATFALLGIGGVVAAKFIGERPAAAPQVESSSPSLAAASMAAAPAILAPTPTSPAQALPPSESPPAPPPKPVPPSPVTTSKLIGLEAAHVSPATLAVAPAARATTSTPVAVPPPTKVDCDPPYVIDSAGHRKYKPECLK